MCVSDASVGAHPEPSLVSGLAHRRRPADEAAQRSAVRAGFLVLHPRARCTSAVALSAASPRAAPVVLVPLGPRSPRLPVGRHSQAQVPQARHLPRQLQWESQWLVPVSPGLPQREVRQLEHSPQRPAEPLPLAASQPPRRPAACSQSQAEPPQPGPRAAAAEQFFAELGSAQQASRCVPREQLAASRARCPGLRPSRQPGMPQPRPSSDAKQPRAQVHPASPKPPRRVAPEAGSSPSPRPACAPELPSAHRPVWKCDLD